MKQKQIGVTIRKFAEAIVDDRDNLEKVRVATGTLIQTLAGAAHDQSAEVFSSLLDRIDAQDVRLRDIEMRLMVIRADIKRRPYDQ